MGTITTPSIEAAKNVAAASAQLGSWNASTSPGPIPPALRPPASRRPWSWIAPIVDCERPFRRPDAKRQRAMRCRGRRAERGRASRPSTAPRAGSAPAGARAWRATASGGRCQPWARELTSCRARFEGGKDRGTRTDWTEWLTQFLFCPLGLPQTAGRARLVLGHDVSNRHVFGASIVTCTSTR